MFDKILIALGLKTAPVNRRITPRVTTPRPRSDKYRLNQLRTEEQRYYPRGDINRIRSAVFYFNATTGKKFTTRSTNKHVVVRRVA